MVVVVVVVDIFADVVVIIIVEEASAVVSTDDVSLALLVVTLFCFDKVGVVGCSVDSSNYADVVIVVAELWEGLEGWPGC